MFLNECEIEARALFPFLYRALLFPISQKKKKKNEYTVILTLTILRTTAQFKKLDTSAAVIVSFFFQALNHAVPASRNIKLIFFGKMSDIDWIIWFGLAGLGK